MSLVHEFDAHPGIAYKDAGGLWWDTYCIRVLVVMPESFKSKAEFHWDAGSRHPFRAEREKFGKMIVEPDEGRFWRTGSDLGFYYYFEDRDIAMEFIDTNQRYISEVERPARFDLVETIREVSTGSSVAGMKTVVRAKLFFNKFRYCVVLNRTIFSTTDNEEINEAMERLFDYDRETKHTEDDLRVRFKYPDGNKIYLRDLNDVILTKMSLTTKLIAKIEHIVLENELPINQSKMPLAA